MSSPHLLFSNFHLLYCFFKTSKQTDQTIKIQSPHIAFDYFSLVSTWTHYFYLPWHWLFEAFRLIFYLIVSLIFPLSHVFLVNWKVGVAIWFKCLLNILGKSPLWSNACALCCIILGGKWHQVVISAAIGKTSGICQSVCNI